MMLPPWSISIMPIPCSYLYKRWFTLQTLRLKDHEYGLLQDRVSDTEVVNIQKNKQLVLNLQSK